jgi:hypothetical protein
METFMWAILEFLDGLSGEMTNFDAAAGLREVPFQGPADSTASGWRLRLPGETMP